MADDTQTNDKPTKATKPTAVAPVAPVFALHRINGDAHLPGDMFRPVSDNERTELLDLKAVRELDDAELALFEKIEPSADPLG